MTRERLKREEGRTIGAVKETGKDTGTKRHHTHGGI